MNFDYNPTIENMFFEDIEKLSLEEQNDKLKTELKVTIEEKRQMLNHITFLQSQISKYENLVIQ
jgi:hypothetical protein